MRIQLSSGKQLRLGVSHKGPNHIREKQLLTQIKVEEGYLRGLKNELEQVRRGRTEAWLSWDDQTDLVRGELRAVAECSSSDNFSRRYGRKEATSRLLDQMRNVGLFTKEDRQEVMAAIFPEYKQVNT